MGAWEYDDQDIEWLSMIMTLHDIGFKSNEIEEYMHLLLKGHYFCTPSFFLHIIKQFFYNVKYL